MLTELQIKVLTTKNGKFNKAIESTLGTTKTLTTLKAGSVTPSHVKETIAQTSESLFSSDIDKIRTIVRSYDRTTVTILEYLVAIAQNITNESSTIAEFFSTKPGSENAVTLRSLQVNFDPSVIPQLFLQTQVALSIATLNGLKGSVIESPTFDSHLVKRSALYLIDAMCKQRRLFGKDDATTKIMTVGIPSGMTKGLAGTFSVGTSVNVRLPKENDVISVKVYRKNYEFEDIIYKPLTFHFDVSKFVKRGTFNDELDISSTLDDIVMGSLQYFDTADAGSPVILTGSDIIDQAEYSFLTEDQREKLVTNHAISAILETYIRLLAGFDMSESSFLIDTANVSISSDIVVATIALLQGLLGMSGVGSQSVTLSQLRAENPEIDDFVTRLEEFASENGITLDTSDPAAEPTTDITGSLTSELLSFAKVFGGASLLSGFGGLFDRITSPKSFERIFHIPIDLDSFEIDEEATALTISGQALLASQKYRQRRLSSPIVSIKTTPANIRLDDIFIVVEPAFEV